jgi:hypothetical protein
MKRILPGVIAVLLLLSACAATGASSADPEPSEDDHSLTPSDGHGGIEHPAGSDAVLVVSSAGGMLPVQFQATQVPMFVLTGDGRVIVQGAQTMEYPGPALPPLMERQLSEDGVQTILDALEDTNLFAGDLELRGMQGMVADANDTVFALNAGGAQSMVTVYALGMLMPDMEPPPGMDEAEIEAYRVLSALNDRLLMLDEWLPADAWATDQWVPYEPAAYRLYVRDVTDEPVEGDLAGEVLEWPADDDPAAFGIELPDFGDGTRCGSVEGDAAVAWHAALTAAKQNAQWTDDGERRFAIQPRPVLPHEEPACPGLEPAG